MEQYDGKRLCHDGNLYHENEALRICLKLRRLEVIFGTIPIIKLVLQLWEDEFDTKSLQHLINDEAEFVPKMILFSLVSNIPNLQNLLITGDAHQLPPYTGSIPKKIVFLGHERIIQKLMISNSVKHVVLIQNFKSHPKIVKALSKAASYGDLTSVLTSDKRD
ncbi:unnamed protein product [Enterobius vermicularis]|uniref:RNA helicase n=1 Tax=Enterobius vermicularis TaxID=51028 RepID=A0A0N4VK09_ENTVE|nr:unnamed protein product [Enterobius vermicularis]